MRIGLGLSLASLSQLSSPPYPSTLSLSGWWKASFAASPWTDQIAGGNLAESTNPPASGTAVNGFNPASFDGVNDELAITGDASSLYATSAYGMVALINVTSFTTGNTDQTAPYQQCQIVGCGRNASGSPGGGISGSGGSGQFIWGHHDGITWDGSKTSISSGAWIMLAAGFDGTNISTSVNAGTLTNTSHGNVNGLAGTPRIGANFLSLAFLNADILEIMTRKTKFSSGELTSLKTYFNARYGLSL